MHTRTVSSIRCSILAIGLLAGATSAAPQTAPPAPSTQAHAGSGSLLVVTKQSHALAIVDGDTLHVTAHVPIGDDPHEVIVGPDGKTAFISNFGEGTLHTLARVDLLHAQALPPIDTTPLIGPHGLWLHDGTLWFTAVASEAIGQLEPTTGRLKGVLGTGQQNTHMLWISRDGHKILASNAGSGTMSLFVQQTLQPKVVPGAPAPPASYTHPEWVPTLLPVGLGAEGLAVSPDETEAWVGNADGTISVLDLVGKRVTQRFDAGVVGANRLRWLPQGDRVLITTHTGKDLFVLDAHTRQLIRKIPIEERGASAIQLDPSGQRAFIACPRDHFVAVVDLHTLERITTIAVGREPDGMTWWTP